MYISSIQTRWTILETLLVASANSLICDYVNTKYVLVLNEKLTDEVRTLIKQTLH